MTRSPRDVVAIKLGGSLITDKTRPRCLRPDVLERLCGEIAEGAGSSEAGLIVGHGSGSYGHFAAKRHGLSGGSTTGEGAAAVDAAGIDAVQASAHELHRLVTAQLRTSGVACFSFLPGSAAVASGGRLVALDCEPIALALDAGLVAVTCGDVLVDRSAVASIASTEAVLAEIALRLPANRYRLSRMLWMGDTMGVYDAAGDVVESIDSSNAEAVLAEVGGARATDVTGGMKLRLETTLRLAGAGVESLILDGREPGVLLGALRGEGVGGTRVVALR